MFLFCPGRLFLYIFIKPPIKLVLKNFSILIPPVYFACRIIILLLHFFVFINHFMLMYFKNKVSQKPSIVYTFCLLGKIRNIAGRKQRELSGLKYKVMQELMLETCQTSAYCGNLNPTQLSCYQICMHNVQS